MRVDIIGWEVYDILLGSVVSDAIRYQERRAHPAVPVLSLLAAAEKRAVIVEDRELALKYGDLNQAIVGLSSGSTFKDVTEYLGSCGLLTYLAARAMVADAKNREDWVAYLNEYTPKRRST